MLRNAVVVATATVMLSTIGLGQQMQGTARAEGRAGAGMRQRVMQYRERAADKLNLTDDQQKQMQKLRLDLEKKNTPLQSQVKLARIDIREQMMADKPDRTRIEKSMKQVSELQFQLKLNGLDHMFAVRNILTPEQLKNWHGMGMGPGGQQMQRRVRIFRQGMGMNAPDEGTEEAENGGDEVIIEQE